MKRKHNTFSLCCGALLTALVCIMTMVIQIPIPLGYAHLGDAAILLGAAYFGRREAVWASGLGSSLADFLTGFTQSVIPTFLIKVIIVLIAGHLMFDKNGSFRLFHWRTFLAAILSMAWMVIGYTAVGDILYGSFARRTRFLTGTDHGRRRQYRCILCRCCSAGKSTYTAAHTGGLMSPIQVQKS